jgi:hypothetical protein
MRRLSFGLGLVFVFMLVFSIVVGTATTAKADLNGCCSYSTPNGLARGGYTIDIDTGEMTCTCGWAPTWCPKVCP